MSILMNKAKKLLEDAESILVFAGAGMSVDSGLPTYRGKEGFWNHYPAYKEIHKSYKDFASAGGFKADAKFTWGFYGQRYNLYQNVLPHKGYFLLKKFMETNKKNYFIISSNIDGLFLKAGYNPKYVHEVHGVIHKLQCSIPCSREVWEVNNFDFKIDEKTMLAKGKLPICPKCKSIARPNIFMFDDNDRTYVWEEAVKGAKRFQEWIKKYSHTNTVILLIGIGEDGLKKQAEKFSILCNKAKRITINLEENDAEKNIQNIIFLQGKAKEILEKLV